ncbi:MAG TPA: type IV pilin [Methanosarcina sp.]|nr:type IV pilin [Methanosarcina sp.]
MDFKKLFRKDEKAVSPVIGVILMVAITVILAAAIGSSVFSKGTAESAPQANLDIKAAGIDSTTKAAFVKFEHLGGNDVNFDKKITKVMVAVGSKDAVPIEANSLNTFSVGNVTTIHLTDGSTNITVNDGETVNVKVIDIQTNQMICDKNIRF